MNSRRRLCLHAFLICGLCAQMMVRAADLPAKFDPHRDAAKDIAAAVGLAKASGRNVILDVGGEWCAWCHILDRFFRKHADAELLRERNFVWIKVNYSPQNKNEAVLARYPKVKGYPHLFVLNAQGELLQSQDTDVLEEEKDYSKAKMMAFLRRWAPQRR